MTKRTVTTLVTILLVLGLSLFNQPKQKNKEEVLPASTVSESSAKVVRVIDGDTIEIENKQKIRYIGMDTPELHHPKKPVQCFAKEAMEKNKELVEGKIVRLEKDVSQTDRYGRLLRYVFVKQEATSTPLFVNEYLVREGYAFAATFPPDIKHQDLFLQAQQQAREQNKGLWKQCE